MSNALHILQRQIPQGAGLGWRPSLVKDILEHATSIDFVEVLIDDYLDMPVKKAIEIFAPLRGCLPIVCHGIGLSVASADGVQKAYVDRVGRLLDALEVDIYSEHLSFHRIGEDALGQFVPVPFTEAWAERVARNVREVQKTLGRTLLLENITYLLGHPDWGMGEARFVAAVLEQSDSALLLDVTNVLTNAANLGYDPLAYVESLPAERILQAHIAGGHHDGNLYIDSHACSIDPASLALLSAVSQRSPLNTALLERDKQFPPFDELLGELHAIRLALGKESNPEQAFATCEPYQTGDGSRGIEEEGRAPLSFAPLREAPQGGPVLDLDAIEPKLLQRAIVHAFQTPGGLRHLYQTKELPQGVPDDSEGRVSAFLCSFPPEDLRAFARVLRTKRRETLVGQLEGLLSQLGDEAFVRLREYIQAQPTSTLSPVEDALGLVRALRTEGGWSTALQALLLHVETILELRAVPFRFWHEWTRRRRLQLGCEPRALERALHGEALPEPLPLPIWVQYIPTRRGIWVEPVHAKDINAE